MRRRAAGQERGMDSDSGADVCVSGLVLPIVFWLAADRQGWQGRRGAGGAGREKVAPRGGWSGRYNFFGGAHKVSDCRFPVSNTHIQSRRRPFPLLRHSVQCIYKNVYMYIDFWRDESYFFSRS
jgi:hypothetical protein